jgi:hypothetical protein
VFFFFFFFNTGSLELFAVDWLQTVTLLISASWVARITGMSRWCPVPFLFISWLFQVFSFLVMESWLTH